MFKVYYRGNTLSRWEKHGSTYTPDEVNRLRWIEDLDNLHLRVVWRP